MANRISFFPVDTPQPMSEQMIEELISKRQRVTLQSTLSPRQTLTFKQLSIYYEEKNLEPTEQFLESLDLRQSSGEFNYAAYLLADDNGILIFLSATTLTSAAQIVREPSETILWKFRNFNVLF